MLMENHHVALAFTLVTDLAREVYYRCKSGVEVSAKSVAYSMHLADPSVEQCKQSFNNASQRGVSIAHGKSAA